MPDTSKDFSVAQRAILRNQRLIMLALNVLLREHRVGMPGTANKLLERVQDMDRYWEFIATPSERLVPFEQT